MSSHPHSIRGALAAGIAAVFVACPAAAADGIYKCTKGSEIIYGSAPAPGANCEQVDVQVPQPSPEEVARMADEQRRRDEQDRADQEQALQERMVRAKELEAQAAWQQARAAQEQAQLQQQQQQQGLSTWNGYYPYYGGWGYGWQPRYWQRDRVGPLRPDVRPDVPRDYPRGGGIRFGFGGGGGRR